MVSAANASGYAGRLMQWGGVLIQARNQREHTELEVLGYPLTECGRPRTQDAPIGRFFVIRPGYLETADLQSGRLITATGRIRGAESDRIGEAPHRVPLLESYKPHVWPGAPQGARLPWRPWVTIGVGGGSGGVGGGVGVSF